MIGSPYMPLDTMRPHSVIMESEREEKNMTNKDERFNALKDHLLMDVGPEARTATFVGKLGEHDVYDVDPPFKGFHRVAVEQFHGLELVFGVEEDGSLDDQDSIARSKFSVLNDLGYEVPW